MNKRLLAGLMAGVLFLGGAASADVDLSGMSYEELIALYSHVISAIADSEGAVTFAVDGGFYTAGVDFPAGAYSIEALDGSFANYDIYDASGEFVMGGVIDSEDGRRIGNIELLDGFVFESDRGARFAPPSGVHFE